MSLHDLVLCHLANIMRKRLGVPTVEGMSGEDMESYSFMVGTVGMAVQKHFEAKKDFEHFFRDDMVVEYNGEGTPMEVREGKLLGGDCPKLHH